MMMELALKRESIYIGLLTCPRSSPVQVAHHRKPPKKSDYDFYQYSSSENYWKAVSFCWCHLRSTQFIEHCSITVSLIDCNRNQLKLPLCCTYKFPFWGSRLVSYTYGFRIGWIVVSNVIVQQHYWAVYCNAVARRAIASSKWQISHNSLIFYVICGRVMFCFLCRNLHFPLSNNCIKTVCDKRMTCQYS